MRADRPTQDARGWRGAPARPRSVVLFATVIVVTLVVGSTYRWIEAPLIGWIAGALVFVSWQWATINSMDAEQTRSHATREDPSRTVTDVLLIASNVASLGAVVAVVVDSADADGLTRAWLGALALIGVAVSWVLVQTLFTVRYARMYYGDRPGGIDFNGSEPPSFADFAYLAFTMGMTYQVSDTNLQTTAFRRAVLQHALLSYLFGTVILATTINLVVGLSSR